MPNALERETEFTGRVLLPWLQQWVRDLKHPGLYVRGDGGPSVSPVVWNNIQMFPDLAIVEGTSKYIALEVKLISEIDSGGSFTKAVGQTVLYGQMGYERSLGIIFDLRSAAVSPHLARMAQQLDISPSSSIHYFRPSTSGSDW